MARRHHRRHHYEHHHRHHRRNPDVNIMGLDAVDTMVKAGGLALTQFVDQQLVLPLAQNFIRTNPASLAGKGLDVATTIVSATVAREGVGLLSRKYGEDVFIGGGILAGGKALAALSGGAISLSAAYTGPGSGFRLGGMGAGAPAARPAVGGAVAAPAIAALPPGGQANYPRPATVDSDVGL
jgi:hypothetical protein